MDNGARSYRRFLDGDESAFDEIMEDVFQGLVFFINRFVRDVHTAEDIAIDTMSDLIVHRHRYNFKVSLKTYLFMIGRSRALDYVRRRGLIDFTSLDEIRELSDDEKDLCRLIIDDEKRMTVHLAISKLPENMRTAVHLIYFEDMSYKDAARIMKKSVKQVDNLIYRAKKELRTILGEDGRQLL